MARLKLANLGSVAVQQGDLDAARKKYQEATSLRNEIGENSGVTEVSLLSASLTLDEGHPSDAEVSARKALEESRAAKVPELEISAHAILAQAFLEQGKLSPARKEIATARPLAAKTQQRLVRLQFEIAAARVQASSGKASDVQAATAALKSVIQVAQKSGILGAAYEARLALGEIETKYGNKAEGRARLAEVEKDANASGFVLVARKAAGA